MINIRSARKDEVSDLQVLNDEVFIDNQQYDDDLDLSWAKSDKGEAYFTNLLKETEACCLIAEEDGKRVGYIAAASKKINYRKSKYIEIENMGVIPDYRSQGIGHQLVQKCLEWAKERGFQKVYVNAYFANNQAIKFYKDNGFLETDISLEKSI